MSDQMPAGPELDAIIAEKVMGWKRVPGTESGAWMDPCTNDGRMGSWSPSTDIAAAWEVVEKLKLSLIPTNKGWIVSQHHLFEGPFGEDETAPLAICRAALAAIAWLANCVPKEEGPKP